MEVPTSWKVISRIDIWDVIALIHQLKMYLPVAKMLIFANDQIEKVTLSTKVLTILFHNYLLTQDFEIFIQTFCLQCN